MCNVILKMTFTFSRGDAMRPAHAFRRSFLQSTFLSVRKSLALSFWKRHACRSFHALWKHSCGSYRCTSALLASQPSQREKGRILCILNVKAGFFVSFSLRRIDLCTENFHLAVRLQVSQIKS